MTMNLTDALSTRAMFEFLARFPCSDTMCERELIVIYVKKIEVECKAGVWGGLRKNTQGLTIEQSKAAFLDLKKNRGRRKNVGDHSRS